jgi:hypothetical protein
VKAQALVWVVAATVVVYVSDLYNVLAHDDRVDRACFQASLALFALAGAVSIITLAWVFIASSLSMMRKSLKAAGLSTSEIPICFVNRTIGKSTVGFSEVLNSLIGLGGLVFSHKSRH